MIRPTITLALAAALSSAALSSAAPAVHTDDGAPARPDAERTRVESLNRAFLDDLKTLPPESSIAAATIREGYSRYSGNPQGFVPDALAVLYPAYLTGLEAFDAGDSAAALTAFAPLAEKDDPWLKANAGYFEVRALVDLGRYEEAEQRLADPVYSRERLDAHTPYAPHVAFLRVFCEARNLRFDLAAKNLAQLRENYPQAPEAIQVGTRQMLLEIERREKGTLAEVATVMQYVADRLHAADTTERVKTRQQDVLALLDKLIEDQQQQEQQQKSGKGGGRPAKRNQGKQSGAPQSTPKEESDAPEGGKGAMDLHSVQKALPGESWGALPPAERERILQSIKERFPSRYRQLVEQYYRSLAEQK